VSQRLEVNSNSRLPITPRNGVVTLFGYGIGVRVDRGHLLFEDGIGPNRRTARLSRVRHGLKRLVVIGSDGMVSLAALRWLADQDAAFVLLERDGKILSATGPVRSSDAKLRRAQALAHESGIALQIARELIQQKLAGQENVARIKLGSPTIAQEIAGYRLQLPSAETLEAIRLLESRAASAYWSAWRSIALGFPKTDLQRVPEHWLSFGSRVSPISNSPRLAANPINAILNYLYALLESESRLAAAALGLDPGMGFLHVDAQSRDSLACDLMEAVRPQVDAYVLDWASRGLLKREWFFEKRDGNCRLMSSIASQLSETLPIWRREVAPVAERVARLLWLATPQSNRSGAPATRLTQSRKREAKGVAASLPLMSKSIQPHLCRNCGAEIPRKQKYCGSCAHVLVNMEKVAELGRIKTLMPEAQAKRSNTQLRQHSVRRKWSASSLPAWMNNETYMEQIQPKLAGIPYSAIASALGVSLPYAAKIRAGTRLPHPRHWEALAKLTLRQN
jgi:CRISPR-associated endonuclease Cas1